MTVEHLLLALLDTPKVREILRACGADLVRLRSELKEFIDALDAAPARRRRRGARSAADAGLPARAAARGVPRAVERPEGSRRRQRARRDLQREAEPRGVPARAGRTSRGSTWSITSRTACRRSPRGEARGATTATPRRARPARAAARSSNTPPISTRSPQAGKIDPLIGRTARGRAHHRDPVPPPQEQPAVRRRSRRRQDRDRRGLGAPDRRGQGARRAAPTARSTRSTWAR